MKIKNVMIVCGTALATMSVTLAVFLPARLDANAPKTPSIRSLITQPKLTEAGCTFTIKTDKQAYQAGQIPRVTINAVNPTKKTVNKDVWVSMSHLDLGSLMSRVPRKPTASWSEKCSISLKPGEKKTISLDTKAKLPSVAMISISISGSKTPVVAVRLPVTVAQVAPRKSKAVAPVKPAK